MGSTALCFVFNDLQQHIPYSIIVGVKFVLCWLGALSVAIQWWRRGVSWLVHANSRSLFTYYYFILLVQGTSYALLYSFEFNRLRFSCWEFDFRLVILVRTIGVASIAASHFIMVAISIERLYSSIYPLEFERSTRRILGVIAASAIVWFNSRSNMIFLTFTLMFLATSDGFRLFGQTKYVATIDLRVPENSASYELAITLLTYTIIPSSLVFTIDVYLNFYRKTHTSPRSLAISYQYFENRKVIAVIFPLEIANSIMTIFPTLAQLVYNAVDPKWAHIYRALFVELSALTTCFPLVFSIILECRIRKSKRRGINEEAQAAHDHFGSLKTAWNPEEKETETAKISRIGRIVAIFKRE